MDAKETLALNTRLTPTPALVVLTGFIIATALLGACSVPAERVSEPAPPARVMPQGVELLLQVRQAAVEMGDALDVQPLASTEVDDLRLQAEQQEARGDFAASEATLAQALALQPQSPQLIQARAEMLLVLGDIDEAERQAARAYESGPRLGPLCRRSWATVRWARELRGDPGGAATAAEQGKVCITPPPVRM